MTRRIPVSLSILLLCLGLPVCAETPKDIFFEQLASQSEPLNTGVKYWIELYRNGKMQLVDSRAQFKSGDKIRFRMIPNVNGYAYIALTKGSSNKQAVLFPNSKLPSSKVIAGKQIVIPSVGFLTFDKQTGTEHIRLAVSREQVNAQTLLQLGDAHKLALANQAPKTPSLVNHQLVAFPGQENTAIVSPEPEEKSIDDETPPKDEKGYDKDIFYDEGAPPVRRVSHRRLSGARPVIRRATRRTAPRPAVSQTETPGIFVINVEPSETLGAEILLEHN